MKYSSDQEEFWAGKFGDEYIDRNDEPSLLTSNLALFSKILRRTNNVSSVIEFGANIGLNLKAIHQLIPNAKLDAIEINQTSANRLSKCDFSNTVYHQSIMDFEPNNKVWDLVFTKGVLIHINPEHLERIYDLLYHSSKKYILIAEYYNPTPISISYRGHSERLFKRDFAGELLDRHPDLKLVDYGFAWRRDPNFPQDDITWFLLEKHAA